MYIFSPNTVIQSSKVNSNFEEVQGIIGEVRIYGGATAPDGWLLCNGAAISRAVYADLFAVVGTTFGAGNGSTTFNIPDLQDRFPIGKSGTKALGSTGGTVESLAHSHTVDSHDHAPVAQIVAHTHALPVGYRNDGGNFKIFFDPDRTSGTLAGTYKELATAFNDVNATWWKFATEDAGAHSHTILAVTPGTDSQLPVTTQNPYQVVNFMIKY